MGGVTEVVARPTIPECLDVGFELMECLLLKKEPVSIDLLERYTMAYMGVRGMRNNALSLLEALVGVHKIIEMLKLCNFGYNTPVPRSIMEQVCMCSSTSMKDHHGLILRDLGNKIYWEMINDECEEIPRPII